MNDEQKKIIEQRVKYYLQDCLVGFGHSKLTYEEEIECLMKSIEGYKKKIVERDAYVAKLNEVC